MTKEYGQSEDFCPECGESLFYEEVGSVEPDKHGADTRYDKCSCDKCGHVWFQKWVMCFDSNIPEKERSL